MDPNGRFGEGSQAVSNRQLSEITFEFTIGHKIDLFCNRCRTARISGEIRGLKIDSDGVKWVEVGYTDESGDEHQTWYREIDLCVEPGKPNHEQSAVSSQ